MDKQQVLAELRQLALSGRLAEEVLAVMPVGSSGQSEVLKQHFTLSEIMYYIGGGIVFLGICVLAYQNWDNFSSFLRIFVTLGSFVAAFVVGSLLYRYEKFKKKSLRHSF